MLFVKLATFLILSNGLIKFLNMKNATLQQVLEDACLGTVQILKLYLFSEKST